MNCIYHIGTKSKVHFFSYNLEESPNEDINVFPKLFSKFAVTSDTGGNGLGLFISKNIIEAHGGRIWADNNAKW